MSRSDYVAHNANAFSAQLTSFANALPAYAASLGVTPAQVTAAADDASFFAAVLAGQEMMSDAARQWVFWRDIMRAGGTAGTSPVVPNPPIPLTAVAPGVEPRFRALAKQIKASPNYNSSIGAALGIEGPEQVGPDLSTVQPDISATVSGSAVSVQWGWAGHSGYLDMCEIQVDRADGKGFVALCFDTTPNYTDTTPFPATPAKWTYQAIYHVGDHRVGQWSKPVSVTVGG